MQTLEHMTVGLTLTESDSPLLSYAAMLAKFGIGMRFEFVHVLAPNHPTPHGIDHGAIRREMQSVVAQQFGPLSTQVQSAFHVCEGNRIDQLLAFVERQSMGVILLGHRSNRSSKRSLARQIAMISPCSVWMVPNHAPVRISRVLAPIDFSQHSGDSLSVATGIARCAGLNECQSLHVYFDAGMIHYEEHTEEIRRDEQHAFEQFLFPINTHDIRVTPLFEESDNVTKAILQVAGDQHADLIVMSTRGRGGAASVLLGSETSQTMMESAVPVLAVKHRGARLNLFQVLTDSKLWSKSDPHAN